MRRRNVNTLFAAGAAVLLAGILAAGCREKVSASVTAAAPAAPAVPVVTVTGGTIESVIEISGTLAAETRVDVRPTVGGTLESVRVHLGDRVGAGTVLATMDRRELDAQVDAAAAAVAVAHASVEAAEAALQNASQEFDRARSLYEKGGIAKQRLDAVATQSRSAQAQRDLAAANVAQADAALRRARETQRDATLRAPMAGVVVARNFDAGSVIGPGGDKPVVAVADMRTLKLEAGVSELEAGRLKIGAAAKVTLSARPGETFDGRVSALASEVDPKDRHFRVEIRVNNQSEALLSGMYATARVVVGRIDGLIAPREAVADRNGSRVVYRVDGDTVQVVRVVEGLSDGVEGRARRWPEGRRSHRVGRAARCHGRRARAPDQSELGFPAGLSMWISNTSIKRPVFATMFILTFVVLGLVSMTRLSVDLFPSLDIPFVNISTVYPGASPAEVETLVSKPIEDAVAGIEGVKRVESNSSEGFSRVGIEFTLGVNAQGAAAEVREKVAGIRFRLPKDVEDPTIARFDVNAAPIATYAVSSPLPADRARLMVEDQVKPLLEQIDGVAGVEVNGGLVREIHIDLDPRRLEALRLPVLAVSDALVAANLDVPGGTMTAGGKDVVLRTNGEFTTVAEIGDVILRSTAGSTVRLKDVAQVVDGYEDRTSTTRLNGVDAVSFGVRKQSGGNTVAITDRINAVLAKNAGAFPDLTIRPIHEDSRYIRSNVEDVRTNIIFGGLMAVFIVFVFMRDWRSTLITALALPTSVIATFFFMWVAGFSFNMMTMMAISLVIGILIDDAVVVRENIYRHMERGEDAMTAARKGTSEIGLAVMATTFTILSVFLPVGFMNGIVGQFFKSFALTVAFAVAMSLVIAFTLDPMLSSRFVRYVPPEERMKTRMGRVLERWGRALRSPRCRVPSRAALGAGAPDQSSRRRGRHLRRQSVHIDGHRHRVRAEGRPGRIRRDGGLAPRYRIRSGRRPGVGDRARASEHAGGPPGVQQGRPQRPGAQIRAPGADDQEG